MNCMNRALLYVTRKKGKSLLLFLILLMMATFVLTGLSIGVAAKQAQRNLRSSLGGAFEVSVDYTDSNPYLQKETLEDADGASGYVMYSTEQLSSDTIEHIRSIKGVKYCDAASESLVDLEQLSLFPGTVPVDKDFIYNTKIVSLWRSGEHSLFTSGKLTLTEGRHITENDSNKAVICKDLAEKSGLGLGDILKAKSTDGKEINLEIIGLFTANETEKFGQQVTTYDKIQNRVFTDLDSAVAIENGPAVQGFEGVRVTVEDPENMEQIIEEVKKLPGLKTDGFTIQADDEAYQNAASSLSKLDKLVMSFLIVILVVSVVILSLILTLWGKARIHETGVFLSIGIKKIDIIGQYLTEVLLIAVIAFGLSFFTSSLVSENIADTLMHQGVQAQSEDNGNRNHTDGTKDGVFVETSDSTDMDSFDNMAFGEPEIEVSVGMENLLQLFVIGFLLITISVTISSVTVMRLKPREILARMS